MAGPSHAEGMSMDHAHYDAGDGFGADDDDDSGAMQHYEPPSTVHNAGGQQTWLGGAQSAVSVKELNFWRF
jgi:hypothetical protein